jgi:hypothetical protein
MTDEPNAALPEPLAHAPWKPSMPLRADATNDQMVSRALVRSRPWTQAVHEVAREFADASVAEWKDRYTVLSKHCARETDDLRAAETALAAARAEVEWLREALERLARLGNGEHYGNSDGNMIARAALAARPEVGNG